MRPSLNAVVAGLLNPRILAAGEVTAIQAATDPDTGENYLREDQGAPGNDAIALLEDSGAKTAVLRGTFEQR